MKYLLLLLLFSCNSGGSKGNGTAAFTPSPTPPTDNEENPLPIQAEVILLNYDEKDKYTKDLSYTISAQSDKSFSQAKIYKGADCDNDSFLFNANRITLASGVSVPLQLNSQNKFSTKILDQNNLESIPCQEIASIYHDTIAPTTLGMSDYLIAANKNVSQLEFYAGGDIEADHPESFGIAKVVYYKRVDLINVKVGEFTVEQYNNKTIRLILGENEASLFYFSVIDLAGNESDLAGLLIVDHQNPSPSAPLLTQELLNVENRYTDQVSFNLKGIVGISTQRVRVYADSNKTQLIADELASVFEGSGISVGLDLDTYNDFFIVAVKNSNESLITSFGIFQKTTPPNKPVVDPYIMQAHNTIEDDDDLKYIAFYGTLDPDIVKVNIYSDIDRNNLLIK
jgi:hypothetical protein